MGDLAGICLQSAVEYVQQDQPEGVPPLALTGERTLPDVPEENYWYRRHLAVYEWIAERCRGLRVVDLACGEGYGSRPAGPRAADVIGVDANPEAFEHARNRYRRPNLSFERGLVEDFESARDAVVFLQTIEHIHDPGRLLDRIVAGGAGRLHLDSQPADPGPAGGGEIGQPVAPARVRHRPVPGAARAALLPGRDPRPLPRPQAARARAGNPCRLGPAPPALADHQALLQPLHPLDHAPATSASPSRTASDRALDFLAVCHA